MAACPRLRQLKLQGGYKEKYKLRITLLFPLKDLEYLSLSNAILVDDDGDSVMEKNSRWLSGIKNMSSLLYLNVYNCRPLHSDFLSYLNESLHHRLYHLNIGMTMIDGKAASTIAKFV